MSIQCSVLKQQRASFGVNTERADCLEAQMIRRVVHRRQCEKIKRFEQIASRLEMRGEKDAAAVLMRAADKLRAITPGVE